LYLSNSTLYLANVAISMGAGNTLQVAGSNVVTAGLGNAISTLGNVTGGNITTGGLVSATGNVTGGNLRTAGLITATGTITGGNIVTAGYVSAVGSVQASTLSIANDGTIDGKPIGYANTPQLSLFSGTQFLNASDTGKHYYYTGSGVANVSIISTGLPVGTTVVMINRGSGTFNITVDPGISLYLAGNTTSANRSISSYGMATVICVESGVWMINGTGVT